MPPLSVQGLAKSFTLHLQGGLCLPVLDALDLEVEAGICVALVGPSGAGKSTVLKLLYGTYRAMAGRILIEHEGRDGRPRPRRSASRSSRCGEGPSAM